MDPHRGLGHHTQQGTTTLTIPFVGIECNDHETGTYEDSGWSDGKNGDNLSFPGWLPGDEAILKLDTTGPPRHGVDGQLRGQLRLYHPRLNRSFSKDLPDTNEKPWQICFHSMLAGYSVEISRPTPAEEAYLA